MPYTPGSLSRSPTDTPHTSLGGHQTTHRAPLGLQVSEVSTPPLTLFLVGLPFRLISGVTSSRQSSLIP